MNTFAKSKYHTYVIENQIRTLSLIWILGLSITSLEHAQLHRHHHRICVPYRRFFCVVLACPQWKQYTVIIPFKMKTNASWRCPPQLFTFYLPPLLYCKAITVYIVLNLHKRFVRWTCEVYLFVDLFSKLNEKPL